MRSLTRGLISSMLVTSAMADVAPYPETDILEPITSHLWIGGGSCDAPLNPVDWVFNDNGQLVERDLGRYVPAMSASMDQDGAFTFTGQVDATQMTSTYHLQKDGTLLLWTQVQAKLDGSSPNTTIDGGKFLIDDTGQPTANGRALDPLKPCPQRVARFESEPTSALSGHWVQDGADCKAPAGYLEIDLKSPVPSLHATLRGGHIQEGNVTDVEKDGAGWALTLMTMTGAPTDWSYGVTPKGDTLLVNDPFGTEATLKRCP